MEHIYNLTQGADPEVFLVDKVGHQVSSEGLFGGTKDNPKPMVGFPDGFYVQEDNVAAEYNIPPCNTAKVFSSSIAKGLKYINAIAKSQGCTISVVSTMRFTKEQLATPHAQRLGCEPDLNAWTRLENPRPIPPPELRTAAGHIHYGWDSPNDEQRFGMAKMFDLFLGIPSILCTEVNERRSLYGKAGSIRLKYYGVECRILDNFWLDKRSYREHIFDTGITIKNILNETRGEFIEYISSIQDEIQTCINVHDKDLALDIMDRFEIPSFPILRK